MNMAIYLTGPVFVALLLAGSIGGWFIHRKKNWEIRYWLIPAFIFYLLLLVDTTLFPIYFFEEEIKEWVRQDVSGRFVFIQPIPFASLRNYGTPGAKIQLIGNLLLLMPMGAFAVVCREQSKAWKLALSVSLVSVGIELTQLAINFLTGYPSRVTDVDDLILNAAGAIAAVWITKRLLKQKIIRKLIYRG